jgi:hypothetical protein
MCANSITQRGKQRVRIYVLSTSYALRRTRWGKCFQRPTTDFTYLRWTRKKPGWILITFPKFGTLAIRSEFVEIQPAIEFINRRGFWFFDTHGTIRCTCGRLMTASRLGQHCFCHIGLLNKRIRKFSHALERMLRNRHLQFIKSKCWVSPHKI